MPTETETTTSPATPRSLQGQTVSPGTAYGPVFIRSDELGASHKRTLKGEEIDGEMARLDSAARAARVSVVHQRDELAGRFSEEQSRIFDAHLKILEDPAVESDIRNRIREQGMPLEDAVRDVLQVYERLCQVVETESMRNKLADLRDVAWRLLQHCDRGRTVDAKDGTPDRKNSILIVNELSVSDLTEALEQGVSAIVAEGGTTGSHGTILTRAAGIPAVIGVEGIREAARGAKNLLVDGESGQIWLDPSPEAVSSSIGRVAEPGAVEELGPAVLTDGTRVQLMAAVASPAEARRAATAGIREIGLYRTELPLIQRQGRPREDSLVQFHGKVLKSADQVQLRLPDLDPSTGLTRFFPPGTTGEKLGPRGVRILLEHPDVLATQLRAILRAAEGRPLRLAIPAVTDCEDVDRIREAVETAREELRLEGADVPHDPQLGVVIETPASALLARELFGCSDFALVGLDALSEHVLAADANSRDVPTRMRATRPHPAVLRAVAKLVQLAEGRDRDLTLYGERLNEDGWLPLLIGLGVRRFALRPGTLRTTHARLQNLDLDQCESVAERAARARTGVEVEGVVPSGWLGGG